MLNTKFQKRTQKLRPEIVQSIEQKQGDRICEGKSRNTEDQKDFWEDSREDEQGGAGGQMGEESWSSVERADADPPGRQPLREKGS